MQFFFLNLVKCLIVIFAESSVLKEAFCGLYWKNRLKLEIDKAEVLNVFFTVPLQSNFTILRSYVHQGKSPINGGMKMLHPSSKKLEKTI